MATLRHRLAAIVGAAMVLSAMLFIGGTAGAQGYPPGTTTLPASCTPANITLGTVTVGQTLTFNLCGPFTPGATASITVNGQAAGTKTANAQGIVTVVITIQSQTTAVVNDPVNVAVVCGNNTVTASGGGTSATGSFNLVCTATTTTEAGGLAFTGANIFKALLVAVALIGLGVLLVMAQRRRRRTT